MQRMFGWLVLVNSHSKSRQRCFILFQSNTIRYCINEQIVRTHGVPTSSSRSRMRMYREAASQPASFIGVCPLSHSQVKRCTACNIFPPEQYHRTRSIVSLTTKEDKQSWAIQQTCLPLRLVAHHNLQQNVECNKHNNQLIKQQNSRGIKLQKIFLFQDIRLFKNRQ